MNGFQSLNQLKCSIFKVNTNVALGNALLVELLITFELVFTIFATCDSKRTDLSGSPSLAIGLAVAIGHLFGVSTCSKCC